MRMPTPRRRLATLALPLLIGAIGLLGAASSGCGAGETATGDPEQADADAVNPAADLGLDDAGLGARSPGQPSPWDRLSVPLGPAAEIPRAAAPDRH